MGRCEISRGALLSIDDEVVVSPLRYESKSFLSGRRTTCTDAACNPLQEKCKTENISKHKLVNLPCPYKELIVYEVIYLAPFFI